jgi:hypothetical protein
MRALNLLRPGAPCNVREKKVWYTGRTRPARAIPGRRKTDRTPGGPPAGPRRGNDRTPNPPWPAGPRGSAFPGTARARLAPSSPQRKRSRGAEGGPALLLTPRPRTRLRPQLLENDAARGRCAGLRQCPAHRASTRMAGPAPSVAGAPAIRARRGSRTIRPGPAAIMITRPGSHRDPGSDPRSVSSATTRPDATVSGKARLRSDAARSRPARDHVPGDDPAGPARRPRHRRDSHGLPIPAPTPRPGPCNFCDLPGGRRATRDARPRAPAPDRAPDLAAARSPALAGHIDWSFPTRR